MVEDQVDNVERLPLQGQAVLVGKIVNAAAKDVVLRNDLLDIECFLETLQTMSWRTVFR